MSGRFETRFGRPVAHFFGQKSPASRLPSTASRIFRTHRDSTAKQLVDTAEQGMSAASFRAFCAFSIFCVFCG
jgi:hypothetical protein